MNRKTAKVSALDDPDIGTIMTHSLTTVSPDGLVIDANNLFQQVTFHHLPVVDDGKLVGIVSDWDIATCMSTQRHYEKTAAEIMTPNPITVVTSTTIECAAILLLENQISCLPVVDDDLVLLGITTWKDLLRFYVYRP